MTFDHFGRRGLIAAGIAAVPLLARAQSVGAGNQQPEITVDRARTAPIPIAIPNLTGTQLGADIAGVIVNNLGHSGLFRPITQGVADTGETPNFATWKGLGAQALVTGKVE